MPEQVGQVTGSDRRPAPVPLQFAACTGSGHVDRFASGQHRPLQFDPQAYSVGFIAACSTGLRPAAATSGRP